MFVSWQRKLASEVKVVTIMENKKQVGGEASKKVGGSSSSRSLDHLFGPKDPSSASSTGVFGSIFPPPSTVFYLPQSSYISISLCGLLSRKTLFCSYLYSSLCIYLLCITTTISTVKFKLKFSNLFIWEWANNSILTVFVSF